MKNLCFILVGAPGSGKTYFVHNTLNPLFPGIVEASADLFFEGPKGYTWDPTKLSQAHRFSQKTAEDAMNRGLPVVVANTSLRHRERKDYVKMAQARGYEIITISFPDRGFKNIHGVSADKVQAMRDKTDLEPGLYRAMGADLYAPVCPFNLIPDYLKSLLETPDEA